MVKLTTEKFIAKAMEVHGDLYDYSKIDYQRSRDKIPIICKVHGRFLQVANSHLLGFGCRKCSDLIRSYSSHRYSSEPCTLYLGKIIGLPLYKIGITSKSFNDRYNTQKDKIEEVYSILCTSGTQAWCIENYLTHHAYKEFKYKGINVLKSGNTEILTKDISNTFLDDIFRYASIAKEFYDNK